MIEVQGRFCRAVLHRCIKGARTYRGKPSGDWNPYFCDEYQVGTARCLGGESPRHFCIDEYEYPNQQGAIPVVMVTWFQAKTLCEAQGKRLCGDDEWTLACEGPERRPFAYGWARDATACNIDRPWIQPDDGLLASRDNDKVAAEVDRLSQRLPSGAMPRCVSPFGVKDMGGNVDEWTVNVTLGGKPYRSMFKGGHWCKGARNRCRPTTESHDESTAYYAEGFRCCSDTAKMP
jgi:formylglycine-generating enzyme required for sulfatase activity